jgi:capsular exopolysaccharide synthesis family protein
MEGLTLRDYIKVLFRQKAMIFLCICTVSLIALAGVELMTPHYSSSVKLIISAEKQAESPYYHQLTEDLQNIQPTLTQSEIVTSRPVLDRALNAILPYKPLSGFLEYEKRFASKIKKQFIDYQIKKFNKHLDSLGLTPAQRQSYLYQADLNDLTKNIKVTPVKDTSIFTITVTDYDPLAAAAIANIVSRSYIIFDLEQQLAEMQQKYGDKNLVISQLRDEIQSLTQNLNGQPLDNVSAIGPGSVKIIEQAYPAIKADGLPKIVILIVAFMVSIFLGCILAFIFDYMDQTFRSPEDIEEKLNAPFLGSVPKTRNLRAFKSVAEHAVLLMKDKSLKTLVLTSLYKREGVSILSLNMAKYISSVMGYRVLVIDANQKHKPAPLKKGAQPVSGLYEILEEKADFLQCIQKKDERFSFLPAGRSTLSSTILLGSQRMADILAQAKEKYELILIDTSNLNVSKDALELSNTADAVVLVLAEGRARFHAVKSTLEHFKGRRAAVLGIILNKRKFPIPGFMYERV